MAALESRNGIVERKLNSGAVEENGVGVESTATDDRESLNEVSHTATKLTKRKFDDIEAAHNPRGMPIEKLRKGQAPVKAEYLIYQDDSGGPPSTEQGALDDDAAEAFHHHDRQPSSQNSKRRDRNLGQNKARKFGSSRDEVALCASRAMAPEFSPKPCNYGASCKYEHDLRKYLAHKRTDLTTFGGLCPVFEAKGVCNVGWKCRFVGSHSKEVDQPDGKKELILIVDHDRIPSDKRATAEDEAESETANALSPQDRNALTRRKVPFPKSDIYLKWLDTLAEKEKGDKPSHESGRARPSQPSFRNSSSPEPVNRRRDIDGANGSMSEADNRALYREPPLLPSEKRRLYFGPETPVLAPLTTQGNLPFRRLCTSLGATFTYSEMAMSLPLLQGHKPEWALIKAHESEIQSPAFSMDNTTNIVYDYGYNQSTDLKFGAQIAASKPWAAIKATEALTSLLPGGLRCVDLNVGCPIDLVYREGAGSALMDSPAKLERMLRGMNTVSGPVPITVKIRTGTRDRQPTAQKLVERLVLGSPTQGSMPCGVAAITLHGRSRQQRYTRSADWEYIAATARLIKEVNERFDRVADTIRCPDERDLARPAASSGSHDTTSRAPTFFLGNGDILSHEHYNHHIAHSGVSTCMIGRGALVKPWLFSEIQSGQYLDKSSSERLGYIESFCRHGLEAWGSDEVGVGQTRRFLLEWLSFAHRYIPLGLLEYLPPNIQDRPPKFRGRDDLETLMASDNYRDWIRISEMFLGPAHKDFRFEPKHKSNSYEMQAEG